MHYSGGTGGLDVSTSKKCYNQLNCSGGREWDPNINMGDARDNNRSVIISSGGWKCFYPHNQLLYHKYQSNGKRWYFWCGVLHKLLSINRPINLIPWRGPIVIDAHYRYKADIKRLSNDATPSQSLILLLTQFLSKNSISSDLPK